MAQTKGGSGMFEFRFFTLSKKYKYYKIYYQNESYKFADTLPLANENFYGNREAMSGDVNFEPRLQRTINVDIRYVLFIIDKYAGATNLIDELDIRKGEPKPLRVEEEKI